MIMYALMTKLVGLRYMRYYLPSSFFFQHLHGPKRIKGQ